MKEMRASAFKLMGTCSVGVGVEVEVEVEVDLDLDLDVGSAATMRTHGARRRAGAGEVDGLGGALTDDDHDAQVGTGTDGTKADMAEWVGGVVGAAVIVTDSSEG